MSLEIRIDAEFALQESGDDLIHIARRTADQLDTGFRNSPITTAAEALEVLHAVPGLMCTLDAGNMETAGPALNAYTVLKDYVVHFHLKDWKISDRP